MQVRDEIDVHGPNLHPKDTENVGGSTRRPKYRALVFKGIKDSVHSWT